MIRIDTLVGEVPQCELLADVGCDHGNLAALCLATGKAKRVIVTDISAPSLNKARTLLQEDIASGRVKAVCCDGLSGVSEQVDVAVIAGMGGKEICGILRRAPLLPRALVLSPHKNAPDLRQTVVGLGYCILRDYTITDGGKYYDIIVCSRGADTLTEQQILFGKTNVQTPTAPFLARIREELEDINGYLQRDLSAQSKKKLLQRKSALEELLK